MGGLMSDLERVRKERGLEGFEVMVGCFDLLCEVESFQRCCWYLSSVCGDGKIIFFLTFVGACMDCFCLE